MAILAAAMLPLLSLQGQFIKTVESFERADGRLQARQNALTYLKVQNFALSPKNEVQLGSAMVKWDAVLISPAIRPPLGEYNVSRYEVSVYNVSVEILNKNSNIDKTFNQRPGLAAGLVYVFGAIMAVF